MTKHEGDIGGITPCLESASLSRRKPMMLYKIGSVGIECHCWPGARYTACLFSHEWLCCTSLMTSHPFTLLPPSSVICPLKPCVWHTKALPVSDNGQGHSRCYSDAQRDRIERQSERQGQAIRFIEAMGAIEQASKDPVRRQKGPVRMGELMGERGMGRAQFINISHPMQGPPIQVSAFQILLEFNYAFVNGGSIRLL